jgi:hypothetical protein
MNEFWNNISRYPRFFISSVSGLILIILTPLRNLLKTEKFRLLTIFSFIIFLIVLAFILASMTGLEF